MRHHVRRIATLAPLCALVVVLPHGLPAQAARVSAFERADPRLDHAAPRFGTLATAPRDRDAARALIGLPAWAAGAVGGGIVGCRITAGQTHNDMACLVGFTIGAIGGGVAGAGLAVGLSALDDGCRGGQRVSLALAGAAAGTAVSLAVTHVTDVGAVLLTLPAATIGGAVFGAARCRPVGPG